VPLHKCHRFVSPHLASPRHNPHTLSSTVLPRPCNEQVDDNRFDRGFKEAPPWEARRLIQPEGPSRGDATSSGQGTAGPMPLDLRVPEGKAVVAITGAGRSAALPIHVT
jgi:hypothetical protein